MAKYVNFSALSPTHPDLPLDGKNFMCVGSKLKLNFATGL